ncbi:MAG: 16S rRNA (guanine(966)-N(2))-methyltransferase RsmD [Bacillota bacterium]
MLKVIGGSVGGRKLNSVKGMATRPTSARVKEALFNILAPRIAGSEVLDLFAGTGSLGIEALSRGAERAVFVDKSPGCCSVVRANLENTGFTSCAEVYSMDFSEGIRFLSREGRKFDLVFLDPPYNKNFIQEALNLIEKNDIIRTGGIIAAEHRKSDSLPERCGGLKVVDIRKYGDTMITIYNMVEI